MPTLGYWNLRGLAQHIRLLLAYTETEYSEKTYELDTSAPEKSNWFAEKFTLGMPFPNLPYYTDGDITLTESNAVARYIARKNGLDGETEQEKVIIDMFENLTYNFHIDLARVCYGPEFEKNSAEYKAKLPDKLKQYAGFLEDKKFVAADKPTLADFHFYDLLCILKAFDPEVINSFPIIVAYMVRFEHLPTIKAYQESSPHLKLPFFAPMAHWGSGPN